MVEELGAETEDDPSFGAYESIVANPGETQLRIALQIASDQRSREED